MGNYRTKLAKSECAEVVINSGKRSQHHPNRESPHSNIKKSRRAEVNYLPNYPVGENEVSLENLRLQITQELNKREIDLMQTTFSLRRHDAVQGNSFVKSPVEKCPALRTESQVS